MNLRSGFRSRSSCAFTLIELLLVIGIIGIMVSLVIATFSNATQDSREAVANQQLAELQSAVNNWVAGQFVNKGVEEVRTTYNAAANSEARFNLVKGYLDDATAAYFSPITGGAIQSDVMERTGKSVTFPTWEAGLHPKVVMQ